MSLRSPLGRVRGLGSAKDGTHHWWLQRLTALALIPLSLWFAAALITYAGADYEAALQWLRSPLVTVMFLLLLASVFYHAQLGLQVVIEDYIHLEWLKFASLIAVKFAMIVLALLGAVAVLRIGLGG